MTDHIELSAHVGRWHDITDSTLLSDIYKSVRMSLGDFGSSSIISAYKKKACGFIDTVLEGATLHSCQLRKTHEFFSFLRTSCQGVSSLMHVRGLVSLLKTLIECKLVCIRFSAVCVGICSVILLHRGGYFIAEAQELMKSVYSRRKDSNELIRRLATLDGICRIASENGQGLVSSDAYSSAIVDIMKDSSRVTRLRALSYVTDRLEKGAGLLMSCIDRVGPAVAARCFDKDSSVACMAIHLLSSPVPGELLLGSCEANFQKISNLIWRREAKWEPDRKFAKRNHPGSDPLQTSRAVLRFIDIHILASPGILSDETPEEKKLAMLLEFVDQYSDGFVTQLNGHLVATVFSAFKLRKQQSFFLNNPNSFMTLLIDTLRTANDTVSSQDQRLDALMKLNTLLEMMLSVIRLLPDTELSQFMSRGPGDALLNINALCDTAELLNTSNRRKFDVISQEIAQDIEARTMNQIRSSNTDSRLFQAIKSLDLPQLSYY